MAKFKKKPVVIEAITWDELVKHGIAEVGEENLTNGLPWSFSYAGHAITQHANEWYLIPTLEGKLIMTPEDMLITGVDGEIYPCKLSIFNKTYEAVSE